MSDLRILDATQTAARLTSARDEILRRWEAIVRERDPTYDQQDPTPLRDRLPEYLRALARCLVDGGPADTTSIANAHGTQRTQLPSYSLSKIFEEYRVLRSVLFSVLEDHGERPDETTRERLTLCIEDGLLEAGQAFAAIHIARERRATERRQQLLEVVSHDLRSPLQTILVATTLVARMVDDDEVLPHLRQIAAAARTATSLTTNLVDIAQIESGGLSVSASMVSVAALLAEAVDRQRENAEAAAVDLGVDPDVPDDAVLADREQLLRVFDNLIGNAIKAIGRDGTITLTATPADSSVEFRISDTGCGIPAHELEHIFDRFWHVQRKGRSGAGLGLAITKGLLEAHGGRIWIESEPGTGTHVRFTLPRAAGS